MPQATRRDVSAGTRGILAAAQLLIGAGHDGVDGGAGHDGVYLWLVVYCSRMVG